MGAKLSFKSLTSRELQAHVQALAQDSGRVFYTQHALDRMVWRQVNDTEVLECLRRGVIQRPAQWNPVSGDVKCRMAYFGSSRHLSVLVALDDDDPDLLVVTVIMNTR